MAARNRIRTILTLGVVAIVVIVGASMSPVSAATLTLGETVLISYDKSEFNISVYPGKASYSGYYERVPGVYESVTGVFGDGTVLGYRFFNSNDGVFASYADYGIVAPATGTDPHDRSESWANVWTTTDPGVDFATTADYTTDTLARGSGITGTIDISGLGSGTVYVICGGLKNDLSLTLTMSGAGQTDIQAEYSVDVESLNHFWVVPFDFSDAGGYETITYAYTFASGDNTRRGRFVGVIVDGVVSDANAPFVDAGADMVTWSGEPVQLDPNIVEKEGSDWTNLTYLWTAEPNEGVVFDPSADVEAPAVTITKATDNPSVVTLTLAVNNEGRTEPPVRDSMTIDVYDDACISALALGLAELDPTDLDEDCRTAFSDFALLAATWLNDYSLMEPVPK